jgi:hypothetical protein
MGGDYLLLLTWTPVSFIVLFIYQTIPAVRKIGLFRFLWRCLVEVSVLVPWTLGMYLLFYRGLWKFTHLLAGYSTRVLASALIFTLLGWMFALRLNKYTEAVHKLDDWIEAKERDPHTPNGEGNIEQD